MTLIIISLILAAVTGYALGAIPFGVVYVKIFKGIDVRQIGSGRTGGTNSFRAAGMKAGVLTAVSDFVKGAVALWLVTLVLRQFIRIDEFWLPWVQTIAGIASVIGHNWSMYINFAGGAGTGPNVGWASAHWLPTALISILVVGGALRFIGMASIASILMALVIPVTFAIRYFAGIDSSIAYTLGGVVTLGIVLWALRPNIKSMLQGDERVVGPRGRKQAEKKS